MTDKIRAALELAVSHGTAGQNSRLGNESAEDVVRGKIQIHVYGKLERIDKDGVVEYYLRIGEDPQGHGSNGVSFFEKNVITAYRPPSGIVTILLRG